MRKKLTAAIEGFFPSPAGGCVTSAPKKITGCWNTDGLFIERENKEKKHKKKKNSDPSYETQYKTSTATVECQEGVDDWPLVRHQNVVDASQLHIDLEAEVGEGLRGCLHHVLHLDTLRGHAQERVSHTLYLRYGWLEKREIVC